MGKKLAAGGRGSNALNAAADVTIEIEKSKADSTATVTEMRDGPEGQQWRFRLLPYEVSATFRDPPQLPAQLPSVWSNCCRTRAPRN
jgi:hypothetical protein